MTRSTCPLIIRICPDDREFAAFAIESEPRRVARGFSPGAALDALIGSLGGSMTAIVDLPDPRPPTRCLRCGAEMHGGECRACAEGAKRGPGKGMHSPMLKKMVDGME